jgi:hypothetical protein
MDREQFKSLTQDINKCVNHYGNDIDSFISDGKKFDLTHLVGNIIEMLRKEFSVKINGLTLLNRYGEEIQDLGKSLGGELTDIIAINHKLKTIIVETCKFTSKAKTTQGTDIFTVLAQAQHLKDTKFKEYKFYAVVTTKSGVSPNFYDHMEQQATKLFGAKDVIIIELDKVQDHTDYKPFVFENLRDTWKLMYEYYVLQQNKLTGTIKNSDGKEIDYWDHQKKAIEKYKQLKAQGKPVKLLLAHKWRAGKTETAIGIMKESLQE